MPKLTDVQMQRARDIHLAGNDVDRARIAALTQEYAEHMGTTLEHLRQMEADKAIAVAARIKGVEAYEYLYSLAAETAQQFDDWCREHAAAVRGALAI
jgi:hypothetical protein